MILVLAIAKKTKKKSVGNDTIDRYPLCASGVLKILCITPKVWGEIYKTFEAFRRLFKAPAPRKVPAQDIRPRIENSAKLMSGAGREEDRNPLKTQKKKMVDRRGVEPLTSTMPL